MIASEFQHLTNQPDESFLHSLTQKVCHDWPISHVAMQESDTFHLTGTLAQKNYGKPDRIKFVSTPLTGHMADRLHLVFRPNYNYHGRISGTD